MIASLSLGQSYSEAIQFTRRRAPRVHMITRLLPRETRVAAWVAYAFFRRLDDLVDENAISTAQFQQAREMARRPATEQTDSILLAWADVRVRHNIPQKWIDDLLDGMEGDLTQRRYATLDELKDYCHQVTATAFLILAILLNRRRSVAREMVEHYAAQTGISVQLLDVMRDIPEDIGCGRCYIPQETLCAYGLLEAELATIDHRDARFQAMISS